MDLAGNQHAVGEKLYFFKSSKPAEGRCLVFAHGGHLWGDAKDFALPGGITLSFNQKTDGKALTTSPRTAMLNKPSLGSMETFEGPTRVKDYSLGKGVGSHSDEKTTVTYEGIEKLMQGQMNQASSWSPHIVTVRRRFKGLGRLVSLGDLVTQVSAFALQQQVPISHFYIAACRGDASGRRLVSTLARI